MLHDLSGRTHRVLTGLALRTSSDLFDGCVSSDVTMADLTAAEIGWYVDTGEPMDKAGAYGIQGHAGLFIEGLGGSYSNVVGLPVHLLYDLLKRAGLARAFLASHA